MTKPKKKSNGAKPPDKKLGARLPQIRLRADQLEQIREQARASHRSVSSYVRFRALHDGEGDQW